MIGKIFNSQAKNFSAAAGILIASGLISRILGIIRDWLLAKNFGPGPELDAYFAAFRIPDLVYNILILGGIAAAFLPLFSEYFVKNKEKCWEFTNNLLNIFLFFLIILSFIFFVFTPFLMKIITPGFSSEQINLTVFLARIMFLSPIFFGLSAIFSGILKYFNRFLIYGLCPILYNLGIILGIVFLTPVFGVSGAAMGVVFGAFFHFLIQIPSAINCGFKYRVIFNFRDPGIKETFQLMIPRTLGIMANQITLLFITAIASTLSPGSLSIFNFANNLGHLPIGIIGVSFAVAAFPTLSRAWAEDKKEEFVKNFSSVFRLTLYLIIPISFLIFILRNQIVGIILRHGQFTDLAAQLTSSSLGLFCFGIFAFSFIPLIFRTFFSLKDTRTPALIAVLGMILTVILSFYFSWLLRSENIFQKFFIDFFHLHQIEGIEVLGLPTAIVLAGIFQFILAMFFLYRKTGDYNLKEIFNSLWKILIAGFLTGAAVYLIIDPIRLFLSFKTSSLFWIYVWQIIIAGSIGVLIYFIFTLFLKSPESKIIWSSVSKQFFKKI